MFRVTSMKPLFSQSGNLQARRNFSDNWGSREKGFEEMEARKQDAILIEKLRAAEEAKGKAENRAKDAEQKTEDTIRRFGKHDTKTVGQDMVSMEEFLTFRREIVDRLRDLEDSIHEMKVSKYRK
eukprot:TRINITY_DN215_c0_g1_i1.p1 TRINITY_DN215_c0_g1~~TRINITY_DN215_c0_g1_i1.p1  ORF type:complete len:125 (-),score=40.58 TRINITY_DN215_c0_g1_i1:163-537(-)